MLVLELQEIVFQTAFDAARAQVAANDAASLVKFLGHDAYTERHRAREARIEAKRQTKRARAAQRHAR